MFKQKNDINWQRRMTRQKGYCTFDAVMWQHCDIVEEYIQAWLRAALKKEKKTLIQPLVDLRRHQGT